MYCPRFRSSLQNTFLYLNTRAEIITYFEMFEKFSTAFCYAVVQLRFLRNFYLAARYNFMGLIREKFVANQNLQT